MPAAVLIWVWFCAWLNFAGWTLSALHELNARGYAAVLAVWLVVFLVWRKNTSPQILPQIRWSKCRRRFHRSFPMAFLILASLAFLGGALHPPTNYDALAYRLPRVLHWLAADQWQWIHTIFSRINNRSCGMEWVSAPFLALLKTDRLLFLINIVSFLLLPGLVFSVFTRLGVRRRVAWHWMWLAPTGYGFLLQAGSIGNDLFGAVFALASVDFALRARISGWSSDFFASILAAAMMTSAKTSSLPLLLPWAIAILPSFKLPLRLPLKTFAVSVLAIFASALPTMYLNQKFSHDWSGAKLNNENVRYATLLKTGANAVLLTIENFEPPVFPAADRWNRAVENNLPPRLEEPLAKLIESPGSKFHLDEMQIEENAGLGFGVSALLLISVVAAFFARGKKSSGATTWQTCARWSPAISLLAVLAESNLATIARVLVPYYLLLLPPLLAGAGHERLVRIGWWRASAFAVFLIAAGLLILSPARPLFPTMKILESARAHDSSSRLPARMERVYPVYRDRNDAFAPARDILPPGLKVLGLTTYDDPETSLWRPFGSRRIEHVCPDDTAEQLRARGVEFILVRDEVFGIWFKGSLDGWLKKMNAQVVQTIPLTLRASAGPRDWHLVKLQ
jgi:hypothetical protein